MSTITFTPGCLVGRYEIIDRIGTGGMAEVYLARPVSGPPDARVALKRMLSTHAHDQRFHDMFLAEARLASTLQHPNIARVFDIGVDHDVCYFAMEYISGHDVRGLVAAAELYERPIPLAISLSIMYGVACALAYVHDPKGPHARLNVVHRDISPSNILVSYDGSIKLVDFGIARVETGAGAIVRTASGQLKGKIPYMSPEQCRARPLDGRSDLFSLGVVLYELTTGRRPFDRASEFETLEAIVRGELTPPSKVVRGYPAELEAIVLRLLATRRDDRYPSAGSLLVDLDRVISAQGLDLSQSTLAKYIEELLTPPGTSPPVVRLRTPSPRPVAPVAPPAPAMTVPLRGEQPVMGRVHTSPSVPPIQPTPLATLSASARAPIERMDAQADAVLATVEPGVTDARELSADAVSQLIGRAMRDHARGDLAKAVICLELALSAARPNDGIDELLASHDELISTVYTAFIGPQARMVALSQHLEQLVGIDIDQRTIYLLTRVDGTLSARELLATCGLPRREAFRYLSQLILCELVVLV